VVPNLVNAEYGKTDVVMLVNLDEILSFATIKVKPKE
jgi:hypothetical protein